MPKIFLAVLTFFVLSFCSCNSDPQDFNPPNIIVFLVDDMGLMDTSVPFLTDQNGSLTKHPLNDYYRTPNMERLAAQGMRFTNFYAHSVCSPTRSSILSGQNAARHGTTNWIRSESNNRTKYGPSDWNWKGLTKASITLPRQLQTAGYTTIHVGKAHFGPFGSDGEDPLNLGFDVNIAGSSIGHPGSYFGVDGFGHIKGQKARAVPGLDKYHGQDIFLTEALTLESKAAITKAKESGKPFFLQLAHYAVHAPFHSDPRFAVNYKDSNKAEKAQAYATLIEGIDKSLGDVMQHIKDLEIGEHTLILFLGDNGSDAPLPIVDDYSSSAPLKGKKGNHWEGGMRVPFLASWVLPNGNMPCQDQTPILKNGVQEQIGSILDLFPTLCNIAGVALPTDHILDGFDLKSQMNGKVNKYRSESFLNHFPHGDHRSNYFTSLVKKDWKIIYHYPIEGPIRYELYNLKEDPFESKNRSDTHPQQLDKMIKELIKEMNDKSASYPENKDGILKIQFPKLS